MTDNETMLAIETIVEALGGGDLTTSQHAAIPSLVYFALDHKEEFTAAYGTFGWDGLQSLLTRFVPR